MKKFQIVCVALVLGAGVLSGCGKDEVDDMRVEPVDVGATEGTGNNGGNGQGSGGGDNPPPGSGNS